MRIKSWHGKQFQCPMNHVFNCVLNTNWRNFYIPVVFLKKCFLCQSHSNLRDSVWLSDCFQPHNSWDILESRVLHGQLQCLSSRLMLRHLLLVFSPTDDKTLNIIKELIKTENSVWKKNLTTQLQNHNNWKEVLPKQRNILIQLSCRNCLNFHIHTFSVIFSGDCKCIVKFTINFGAIRLELFKWWEQLSVFSVKIITAHFELRAFLDDSFRTRVESLE